MKRELALPSTCYTYCSGPRKPRPARRHLPAAIADLFPLTSHPRRLPTKLVAEFYSPKCLEYVLAESPLERDALLGHFEFNPRIRFYVPHPLRVDMHFGKRKVSTVFDAASWDGCGPVQLWEFKPDTELNSKRVATRQLPTQESFCVEHGYGYRLLVESEIRANPHALGNWSAILGYLVRRRHLDLANLEQDIRGALDRTPLTMREVLRTFAGVPNEWIRTATYRLIHAGLVQAEVSNQEFTDDVKVRLAP